MEYRMEKVLTFTVEDALLSPIGYAILSGAGLFGEKSGADTVRFHSTSRTTISENEGAFEVDLTDALGTENVDAEAPIYVIVADEDGQPAGELLTTETVVGNKITVSGTAATAGTAVFVDYYIAKPIDSVEELQIDAEHFAGYWYVEADTLFRRQRDGKDMDANFTLPNVKVQSNFTFAMSSSGDPSEQMRMAA